MQPAQIPSLYDSLGGVYSIATVVDDLINRVTSDPRLNSNPLVDEAHHRVPPAGFQVSGDRDGLLGCGRPAKVYGEVANEIPPLNESFKRLQAGGFADWRLSVNRMVERPASFSLAQLKSYPSRSQVTQLQCEEGWSYIA